MLDLFGEKTEFYRSLFSSENSLKKKKKKDYFKYFFSVLINQVPSDR